MDFKSIFWSKERDNETPYELDGKPSLKVALPLGLQHILAMFAGNLAPILILSTVAGGAMGLTVDDKIFLVQMAMFASGVATLIQLYPLGKIGSRLPIVMGTSFSFLGVAIYVGFNYGIAGIFGAALVGSIVEIVLGFTMPYIRKYFTPLITGIVVLGIGFSLLHVGVEYMAGGTAAIAAGTVEWKSLLVGMLTLLIMLGFNIFGKGMWKSSAILLGLVIGFLIAIPFGMVDTAIISQADWFLIPTPLRFGLEFHFEAIFLFGAIYIITAMETVGDCAGVTLGGLDREPTSEEVSGSILADAFGSTFAALFGALPNTSFSQNVGIISMTKVVSRYVVMLGAVFLIGSAFIPKFGALFLTIPTPVLGGVLILIFGIIAVNGVRMIGQSNLAGRDGLILALAFGIGFGVTAVPGLVDLFAEGQALDNNFLEWYFADTLIAAGLLAFFLNLVLPKDIEF